VPINYLSFATIEVEDRTKAPEPIRGFLFLHVLVVGVRWRYEAKPSGMII